MFMTTCASYKVRQSVPVEREPEDMPDSDDMGAHASQPIGPECYTCHVPRETADGSSGENGDTGGEDLEEILVTGMRGPTHDRPYWNTWFEGGMRNRPEYVPEPRLGKESTYTMFLNLSGKKFDIKGAASEAVSTPFGGTLEASQGDVLNVQILVVANPSRIRLKPGETQAKTLTVDLAKYRVSQAVEGELPTTSSDPLYSLGSVAYQIQTLGQGGVTSIGVSIWVNGVPLDELNISLCIGSNSDCADEDTYATTLSGLDSTRIGQQLANRPAPDGAIQFVDLWGTSIVGVFRCNVCNWGPDKYVTWLLNRDADQLQDYLARTIQPAFQFAAGANDNASFEAAGRDLYRVLFGHDDEAETVFENFVAQSMLKSEVPSLFVRMLYDETANPLLVPLGLTAVPVEGQRSEFIGNIFRLESPLPYQDYEAQTACLKNWTLLVPPPSHSHSPLDDAREKVSGWISAFKSAHAVVYEQIPPFRDWLEANDQDFKVADQTGIIILSHHENNRLFFDELNKTPNITSATVDRKFDGRSIAIINACGAASPGASEFVDSFNRSGVATIVATSTTVDARMAGDFLNYFGKNLQSHRDDDTYNIGYAVYDSIQDLKTVYGVYALIYGLYGNGNLRACFPDSSTIN